MNELKELENSYLLKTLNLLDQTIEKLGGNLEIENVKINEFQKFIFQEIGSMDKYEIQSNLLASEIDKSDFVRRSNYLKKLLRIKDNPYFGRIDFKTFDNKKNYQVYVGITYLTTDENENLIYDWRSPIASLFYQNTLGKTSYLAPSGLVTGELLLKRQYKIVNRKLVHIFDNSLNITDDLLQQVLATNSSDKMKNIVNTIQEEQNDIIRNLTDKNLIVEGIAGSGKTSVALHRIAYLLYQIPNLQSSNILIFSPNNLFSTYISNVLPELGEDNTKETTFSDFQSAYLKEYKKVESFPDFLARFYQQKEFNKDLVKLKQSDIMIKLLEDYVEDLSNSLKFQNNYQDKLFNYSKEFLNDLLKRYSKLTIYERFQKIAEYICLQNNLSYKKLGKSITNKLFQLANFNKDIKVIYQNFYKSKIFQSIYPLTDLEIKAFVLKKEINYEDSLLLIYLKGLINEFPYSNLIKEIVIDEAQDYNLIEYIILKKIFPRASFTILGDVNQTINPYYHYKSLNDINKVIKSKYLRLTKTYRSSKEIIAYANKILNLNHVVAIRKSIDKPVLKRKTENIESLIDDINYGLKSYKRIAIITKNDLETNKLYQALKPVFNISNMLDPSLITNPNLVIIPAYLAKGLEFDFIIVYTDFNNRYLKEEKYLFYVAVTRCQHELIVYNQDNY